MTIDDKIRDEKLQYGINRKAAKISASSSGKFDKSFEIKTIVGQWKKQVEDFKPITQKLTIKDAIRKNALSKKAKNELNKIKEIEKTVTRENLYYRTNEQIHYFQNFRTINSFGRDIYNATITMKEANIDQSGLLVEILIFRKQVKPKNKEKKQKK